MKQSRMRKCGVFFLSLILLFTTYIVMAEEPAGIEDGMDVEGIHTSSEGQEAPETVEVRFVVGDEVTLLTLNIGDVLEKPKTDPEAQGAKFLYWYDAEDVTKAEFEFGYPVEEGLTLVALFEAVEDDTPKLPVKRSVRINSNVGATVSYGDIIVLTGELDGYDGVDYTVLWEVNSGNGWTELRGENGLNYSFILDEHNIGYQYRLAVTTVEG